MATPDTTTFQSGYENEFISPVPDNLKCFVCHFPSRNPYQTKCCGHHICNGCLKSLQHRSHLQCPMCRKDNFKAYFDMNADRQLKSLFVLCENSKKGCQWMGELSDSFSHLDICKKLPEEECKKCKRIVQQKCIEENRHFCNGKNLIHW